MAIAPIRKANKAYEDWLRVQLRGDLVEVDLRTKHAKMASGPFPFLRATYWRWAETILEICPKLKDAPAVLAVGDIHLENFGSWRDIDGRLIWGVNDFDEAAKMPYALDLVRLGPIALLGCPGAEPDEYVCGQILKGYHRGLEHPHAIVLDQKYAWLRNLVVVPEADREHFWAKIEGLSPSKQRPPQRFAKALAAGMPASKLYLDYHPRTAGAGSLGRPRWVAIAQWQDAPLLREAKAVVPSAWTRGSSRSAGQAHRCYEIATGRYRAPDPWYRLVDNVVVRRLSPNNRKIEAAENPAQLTSKKMLRAMGHELASIHLGSGNYRGVIERDLDDRKRSWLVSAVGRAVDFIRRDYKAWIRG